MLPCNQRAGIRPPRSKESMDRPRAKAILFMHTRTGPRGRIGTGRHVTCFRRAVRPIHSPARSLLPEEEKPGMIGVASLSNVAMKYTAALDLGGRGGCAWFTQALCWRRSPLAYVYLLALLSPVMSQHDEVCYTKLQVFRTCSLYYV